MEESKKDNNNNNGQNYIYNYLNILFKKYF